MSKDDRDLLVACGVFLGAVGWLWLSLTLPMRGDFVESPGIFPTLMSGVLILLAAIYTIRSLVRGGRIRAAALCGGILPFLAQAENRPVFLGILSPAVYVFVGIPLVGFYISSAIFLAVMFHVYVTRWRRWMLAPLAAAITALLYVIFTYLFQSPIW